MPPGLREGVRANGSVDLLSSASVAQRRPFRRTGSRTVGHAALLLTPTPPYTHTPKLFFLFLFLFFFLFLFHSALRIPHSALTSCR